MYAKIEFKKLSTQKPLQHTWEPIFGSNVIIQAIDCLYFIKNTLNFAGQTSKVLTPENNNKICEAYLMIVDKKISTEEEKKIRQAFKEKSWSELKGENSWAVFKIMSEFVEGFEKLSKIGPCVSIYGSARTLPDNKYYILAKEIASQLVKKGYGVITGGGPGIMEAGNKGAYENGGKSVGVRINLPFEPNNNVYVDRDKLLAFDFFFVRKVMLMKFSQGFIVMPGGLGTLDELFEALTLVQTSKVGKFPIILVGKDYWKGLMDWLKTTVLEQENNMNAKDLELFNLVDTAEEVVSIIEEFYAKYLLQPNF